MYKYSFFIVLALSLVVSILGIAQVQEITELKTKNQELKEHNKALVGKVFADKVVKDSLNTMLHDYAANLDAYMDLLRQVGVLVQRECPDLIKNQQQHGPSLRRPQSLDPRDLPKAPLPQIEM